MQATNPWDDYWRNNDSTNSFEFDYSTTDGPYGVVNKFWQNTYKTFLTDATIVDIAAGNGALSNLYLQCSDVPSFKQWWNVDSAQTQALVKHEAIQYTLASAESLPFSDNSIQHFVSMFGIEYSSLERSLSEVKRCLSVNGTSIFMLHHHQSIISQQSRITVSVLSRLVSSSLFNNLESYQSLSNLKQHLLSSLNNSLAVSKPHEQDDVKIVGQQVFNIIQQNQSCENTVVLLCELKSQLIHQTTRLEQQLCAADQSSGLGDIAKHSQYEEFDISVLTYQDNVLAWTFSYQQTV
ncbi:MAG: methyltransferase domain-containing protein [Glaciecola sp.]